ncbi:PAS domain-containing protein [Marivirga tractuosa]|uniref:PAS domain-containing protein n=1 Tax=Marivirga tractuosa TaxID=1006 RepID=UPI0035CF71D0
MRDKIYTYFDVLNQHSIISATNLKGEIKYVNDQFCKISKYNEGELIGAPHSIVNSGYHHREYFKDLWRTIGRGNVWQGNILNEAKDGSQYWVATTIVPIIENKRVKEYFSVRIEKTEEMRLEKEKSFQERRFSQLFNHISEGVIVMKKMQDKFIITDFNHGAEKLDKKNKEEVIGREVSQIYPGTDSGGFTFYIEEAYQKGHASFPLLRYQDENIDSWRKGAFYKLPNDEVVCVYHDISEQINQLEQLKKYNEKLEEVAFKASHEVRAPVASILGLMQLIDFDDLSENNKTALEYMKDSVGQLDHTIRDIVKVSYDTEEGKELFAKLSDLKEHFHNS